MSGAQAGGVDLLDFSSCSSGDSSVVIDLKPTQIGGMPLACIACCASLPCSAAHPPASAQRAAPSASQHSVAQHAQRALTVTMLPSWPAARSLTLPSEVPKAVALRSVILMEMVLEHM